jgi:hypothetical protein
MTRRASGRAGEVRRRKNSANDGSASLVPAVTKGSGKMQPKRNRDSQKKEVLVPAGCRGSAPGNRPFPRAFAPQVREFRPSVRRSPQRMRAASTARPLRIAVEPPHEGARSWLSRRKVAVRSVEGSCALRDPASCGILSPRCFPLVLVVAFPTGPTGPGVACISGGRTSDAGSWER